MCLRKMWKVAGRNIKREETAVYNMEVREFHTYYIANSGVLVHNNDRCARDNGEVWIRSNESGKNSLSGNWKNVNESMSDFSRKYQTQITGQEGKVWYQNGVKFDEMRDGTLLEAMKKRRYIMIQKYSIILWRKAELEEKSFDEIAKETYDTLCILQEYNEILRPNYLTVKKKSNVSKFEWNYEMFSEVLNNGVITVGKNKMNSLGYSLSFFSSLNENESCGISLRVGNKDSRFVNSFIIELPISLDFNDNNNSYMIDELFCKLVNSFGPFWGCVSNNKFQIGDLGYMNGSNPLYVHWLNYWSGEVVSTISSKFFDIIKNVSDISFQDGILLLRDSAFDCRNENDTAYFQEINKYYLNS